MSSETVYLNISQISEVHGADVRLKDVATVHCQNKTLEADMTTVKIHSFEGKSARQTVYVGSTMDVIKAMEEMEPGIQINNLGETDFVVKYKPRPSYSALWQWAKTAFVCLVCFCGAAFAIMTFNNDASVTDVFANLYRIVMGTEPGGTSILELSYSIGLAAGILLFFNHFASWKITSDPTPIEVEMRLYEDNLNKTLIQNHSRKESEVDVS